MSGLGRHLWAVKGVEMNVPSAAIVGECDAKRNLRTGSAASHKGQPHLRIKAVCRQFRDRAVTPEADAVEKDENMATNPSRTRRDAGLAGPCRFPI